MNDYDETIIAKSTASGSAFRGIIRLTGSESVTSLQKIFEPNFRAETEPCVFIGHLFPWGANQQKVPAKIFYWNEGRGYTGQQTVEIHTLGSPPILDAIISSVTKNGAVRLARPGEFTLRAFLSGRLDLTQAEAVLGVIDAPSPKSLETALCQLAGGMASPLKQIRATLFETLVQIEAAFDFPEEEIEFISLRKVRQVLTEALEQTESLARRMEIRGLSSEKPKAVLVGPPNAGKSTLFNALLESDKAIVSPTPGTTRDYLEAEVNIDGILCTLIDTAGTDTAKPTDAIDEAARIFSKQISEQAAVIIYCSEMEPDNIDFDDSKILFVQTKSDLSIPNKDILAVSSKTGAGIEMLRKTIAKRLKNRNPAADVLPNTALRCRDAIDSVIRNLHNALESSDELLLASELRLALNSLGLIDGSIHTEDILDAIFNKFCIGK